MVTVNKSGQIILYTKVIGEMELRKVKENSFILMGIYMRVISIKIDQMEMENILILTVNGIKVCGKMT